MKYCFGQFKLDTTHRLLIYDGEPVTLSAKTYDLLCELVRRNGTVVTKDQLLESVWPDQFVEENNLSVQISALRKILGEYGDGGRFITTVPGRGYSFVGDVEEASDESEIVIENRTIERITIVSPAQNSTSRLYVGAVSSRVFVIVFSFAALIGIGFIIFRNNNIAPKSRIASIAVLPFENQTSDETNEYLTDGLAESVTFSLSQIPGIRVMSRGSAYRYKGRDPGIAGSELNVDAVLTGRVTRRGDTLNVSAELVSAADNSLLWGEQFSRKMEDLEKLQTDIAGSISDKLRFQITRRETGMTGNAEAYRTYLEALYYWNKRTPDDLKKSIDLFHQAISLDPGFGQAYGGLAMAYAVVEDNGVLNRHELDEFRQNTRDAVDRAMTIDENLAEAHAVLGVIKMHDWDFDGSEREFKRAIEINRNFATAHLWYFELLSVIGRHYEAGREIDKAYALDPFSRVILMSEALQRLDMGYVDEAVVRLRKLREMEPEYPLAIMFLSNALEENGMLEEAIEPGCTARILFKIETPESCARSNAEFKKAFSTGGADGYWRKSLERYKRDDANGACVNSSIAAVYFWMNDKENGYRYLEKAYAGHDPEVTYIMVDAPFKYLAGDPQYVDLIKRIGLPQ